MPKKKGELSIEERLEQSIVAKEEEPYKLPSNWVWTRLENISHKITDGAHKTPTYVKEGVPFISVKDIRNNEIFFDDTKFITLEEHQELYKRCNPEKGDVLVTKSGTIGRTAIVKDDFEFSLFVSVALIKNIKNVVQSNFLSYAMQDFINKIDISRDIKGGVIKNYHISDMKKQLVPLPPLEEQKRIVEKLDSLFEKIQKIKEIIEEVKEKTTSRREAILFKAFSGELTEKWRGENHTENARELLVKINDEKLKLWEDECKKAEDEGKKKPAKPKLKTIDEMLVGAEEEPYKLPNNWIWTRLGDITNVVSGGTPSTSKEEYYNGNIPWITPKDLSNYKEKYILNGARNITEEGLKKSSAVLLPINSVLMSSRAPIGYVVINKKEVSTNQGFKSFTPSISYIPEYLYHYLKKSKNYLESIATGTTFKELSGDKAKKIIFPLPPLEEQKEIVRVLDKVFEEENRISELISLENKIEILEKTILDRAFRGELGTGNNDDEPAIELLRRCLEGKR
ncbi:restriction endonuclease subunit S [uncultured Fusobacterium sp.]|uniref:restriction endonuclease subunit S n=1 Tax=uncultured Fusobacterium sp. TaxID=159267 RepID=UPI0028047F8E|nr:restriction endonuclease subunit S [uncultured Fusobacterium sp.]